MSSDLAASDVGAFVATVSALMAGLLVDVFFGAASTASFFAAGPLRARFDESDFLTGAEKGGVFFFPPVFFAAIVTLEDFRAAAFLLVAPVIELFLAAVFFVVGLPGFFAVTNLVPLPEVVGGGASWCIKYLERSFMSFIQAGGRA